MMYCSEKRSESISIAVRVLSWMAKDTKTCSRTPSFLKLSFTHSKYTVQKFQNKMAFANTEHTAGQDRLVGLHNDDTTTRAKHSTNNTK